MPRIFASLSQPLTLATSLDRIARQWARKRNKSVDIIHLEGSVEMAPQLGLADLILDRVSTGTTLQQNGLVEIKTLASSSARLIVNPVQYRVDGDKFRSLLRASEEVTQRDGERTAAQ